MTTENNFYLDKGKDPKKFSKRKNKKTIIKLEGYIPEGAKKGKIVGIEGTNIIVETMEKSLHECTTGGAIISNNTNQSIISVGDVVYFVPGKSMDSMLGTIVKVDERRNHFSRKEVRYPKEDVIASNIDCLVIMASVKQPEYNKRLIDRFLVTAELNRIEAIICVNKIDLGKRKDVEAEFDIYRDLGIKVFFSSAKYNIGLEEINLALRDKTSVLAGQSGSGKSTFLNSISGQQFQTTGDTSRKTNKGKHTTSAVRMFSLESGGYIIDTPGVREFGVWGLSRDELALYFHEFDEYNPNCKYYPCTHTHEPGCAVIKALEEEKISIDRYESYLLLYDTLE